MLLTNPAKMYGNSISMTLGAFASTDSFWCPTYTAVYEHLYL